ncbi:MAG: PAS domain S-box protein [Magnetococcales bacterium]|nr:PAS domain S-box protein [Magnetococcales bacterium]
MNILVVDDNENARLLAQTVLISQGYGVETASNGKEALAAIRQKQPDLVITDILMPEMDGFDLCRTIKEDAALCHIPLVFYTATYTDPKDERFAMELGASRFIIKPLEVDHFVSIIREILGSVQASKLPRPNLLNQKAPLDRLHVESLSRKLDKKIKDLEREQEALRKSEERYRDLLETTSDWIWESDLEGHFTYASPQVEEILGYTPEEITGQKSGFDLMPPQEAERIRPLYQAFIQSEKSFEGLVNINLHKDGRRVILESSGRPFFDSSGKLLGYRGVGRDTTERVQTEEKLKESESRFRNLYENAPLAYQSLNAEGRLIAVNKAWLATLGFDRPQQVLGRWFGDFLPPDDQALFRNQFAEFKKTGENHGVEFEIVRHDGVAIQVSFEGRITRDPDGNFLQTHCLLSDITERHRLEMQLRQSQKMEAIGTLAGGIAHDFNNILGSILGYTDLARDTVPDHSQTKNHLDQVFKAGIRAKELVARILIFARRDKEKTENLELAPVIQESLKLIQATIPGNIHIQPRIVAQKAVIHSNTTLIQQIVMNLCINAATAMGQKGGELIIALEETEVASPLSHDLHIDPGHYVLLTVEDNGCGIPANLLEKVIDPFFTTKDVGHGTGLGLSVVHGIVKNHDGALWISSEAQKGTVVRVYLPLAKAGAAKKPPVTAENPRQALPKGKGTILLVDDDKALLEMGKAQLEWLGYDVLAHSDPNLALELLRKNVDCAKGAIIDQEMPHMKGSDLIHRMFSLRPDLPIFLCTGNDHSLTPRQIREMGVTGLLQKPVLIEKLANTLHNAFKNGTE